MTTAFCFDLDGTVTCKEILPILAREVGIYEEIQALTEATIKGIIPFRRSFLLRCRLLSEIPISKAQEIIFNIPLHEKIVDFIKSNQKHSYVVTGNLDVWIMPLVYEKLKCKFYSSRAEAIGDRITLVTDVLNKEDAIKKIRPDYERIVSIGDGMGDVPMFDCSDETVAFGGVHHPIETLLKSSKYVTYDEVALCRLLNTLL